MAERRSILTSSMVALTLTTLAATGLYFFVLKPIKNVSPSIQRTNIRGDGRPELFFESRMGTAYAEIDGQPVREYLENLQTPLNQLKLGITERDGVEFIYSINSKPLEIYLHEKQNQD